MAVIRHFTVVYLCLLIALLPARVNAQEAAPSSQDTVFRISYLLPKGWEAASAPKIYSSVNLYSYIDGGADLFIRNGFKRLDSYSARSKQKQAVLIDIYNMGQESNARAVFYKKSSGNPLYDAPTGAISYGDKDFMAFYKNYFYIEIQKTAGNKNIAFEIREIAEKCVRELEGTAHIKKIER